MKSIFTRCSIIAATFFAFSVCSNAQVSYPLPAGSSNNGFAGIPAFGSVFIGSNAGASNTGTGNTFVGSQAGRNNTKNGGTFVGDGAGLQNKGNYNTGFGGGALQSSLGEYNVGIGTYALAQSQVGSYNVGLGSATLNVNNGGNGNVALGYQALLQNFTGNYNIGTGYQSGFLNTTGNGNIFTGYQAGYNNNSGSGNIFIGGSAGYSNKDAWDNIFIGRLAGYKSTGGSNIFTGYNSGLENTTGTGNVFSGWQAGNKNVTGSNNTYIGISANGAPNISNATAIGAEALVTSSNAIQLGDVNVTKVYAGVGDNATLFAGKIGVGTQTPEQKLHIYKGSLSISTPLQSNDGIVFKNTNGTAGIYGDWGIQYWGEQGKLAGLNFWKPWGNTAGVNGNYMLFLQDDGKVGIGTAPSNKLHVLGESGLRISHGAYGVNGFVFAQNAAGDLNITYNNATAVQTNIMTLQYGGNVGIGVLSPTYQLQLSTNSAAKPGSALWTIVSDRRLKTNISEFKDGLDVLKKINPIWFNYTGEADTPKDKKFVGIIAQEMQEVAPYTVGKFEHKDKKGNKTEYLDYDGNAVTYILINSIKEQQKMIEQLQAALQKLGVTLDETKTNNVSDTVRTNELKKETNESSELALPKEFGVESYPNPFNPTTTIKVALPASTKLTVGVYDITGRVVRTIANEQKSAGYYMYEFNGSALSSGTYFIRVQTDAKMEMKKIMLVK